MSQHFLITVQRMCISDEAALVSGWSAVVAEENLLNFGEGIGNAARLTEIALKDCPVTNLRPMTEAEITEWRNAQKEN
jgi:hypothetical protein